MKKFKEYVDLKEKRLRELLTVIEPALVLKHLSCKMCRSGSAGYETIKEANDPNLLLSEFPHFRVIDAIIKSGYQFHTGILQELRNELYQENYGLICDAVWNASGTINSDLVSMASIAFLEAIDNLSNGFEAKPQTYIFKHILCRLKENISSAKQGMSIITCLKKYCRYEDAEELITQGKVKVNGKPCYNKKQIVSFEDEILVGEEVQFLPAEKTAYSVKPTQFKNVAKAELWKSVCNVIGKDNMEIVYLKMSGYSNSEISDELGIPPREVREILRRSLGRLKRKKNEFTGFSF